MSDSKKDSHRIVLNTAILFGRLVITIVVVLFSTRIVLRALGSADFGIFSLVSGLVLMLAFLNAALGSSTQRFLSYYHGIGDGNLLKKVFTNSLFLHIFIGVFIVVFILVVGFFLFNGFLNIAPDRVHAARLIYNYTALAFFFNIVSVPFTGALTAHENQLWTAVVNLFESFSRLGIAYYLLYTHGDKLIVYGILMNAVTVVKCVLFSAYCFRKYPECTVHGLFKVDKPLLKELTSFAGWNLFGVVCSLGRFQGVAIILNRFFGTVANAAYGVSNQIGTQLNYMSESLLVAVNPQIMRAEGNGDRRKMLTLATLASKYGCLIMAGFSIPILFELPSILHLWLKDVPPHTVSFCSLTILAIVINQETVGLQSAVQAIGSIKLYQIVIGSLMMLNLPVAYFLLHLGFPAYWAILIFVLIEALACVFRLFFLRRLAALSIREYSQKVFLRQVVPIVVSVLVSWTCYLSIGFQWRWVVTIAVSCLCFAGAVYLFGMGKQEKKMLQDLVANGRKRFLKK
ncbi:MAG: MATE family efflux transporter [Chitinophagaceae bacterium]